MNFSDIKMSESKKRRTEITIETHSITIIRTRNNDKSGFVYCRNCKTNVASFRQSHAALIFRVDPSELVRLFQINLIHAADNDALCGSSLATHFNKEILYVED